MLGQGRTCANNRDGAAVSLASDTPGHPARGRYVIAAGLLAHGSTPCVRLPEGFASVASMDEAHRLQLRGQLRICAIHRTVRTAFPLGSGSPIRRTAMVKLCEAARTGSNGKLPTAAAQDAREVRVGRQPRESRKPILRTGSRGDEVRDAFGHAAEKIFGGFSLGILNNRDFCPAIHIRVA